MGGGPLGPPGVVHAHEQDGGLGGPDAPGLSWDVPGSAGSNGGTVRPQLPDRPRDTRTGPTSTGTSISGPTTPARARPEVTPKVPTATATAGSTWLPAAVEATVVDRVQLGPQGTASAGTAARTAGGPGLRGGVRVRPHRGAGHRPAHGGPPHEEARRRGPARPRAARRTGPRQRGAGGLRGTARRPPPRLSRGGTDGRPAARTPTSGRPRRCAWGVPRAG